MRMKLTKGTQGVTLEYDEAGERVSRYFTCPHTGGTVMEWVPSRGDYKTVCEGLYITGQVLHSPSFDALADVIRQEYKARKREEKRNMSTYSC